MGTRNIIPRYLDRLRSIILIPKLAWRNLSRSKRRTKPLFFLVMGSMAIITLGNAFLDGTEVGLRRSYAESFTGDVVIRTNTREAFSLFGSATPVFGGVSDLPPIADYEQIVKALGDDQRIEATASVVCGGIVLESGAYKEQASGFGVDGNEYFACFPTVRVVSGSFLKHGLPGLMMTQARASRIAAATGRAPAIGDLFLLGYYSSSGFQLREAPLQGILEYPTKNDTLDSIILVDDMTMRELLGISSVYSKKAEDMEARAGHSSTEELSALFDTAQDSHAEPKVGLSLASVEQLLLEPGDGHIEEAIKPSSWHFILARAKTASMANNIIASLTMRFKEERRSVLVGDWREGAGASAIYVIWLRKILGAGYLVVILAGVIIVINAFVLSVFERTGEIGTMRALGASRTFIRGLFVTEMLLLMLGGVGTGIALGAFIASSLGKGGVAISNQFIATLFGSSTLVPIVTPGSVILDLVLAIIIAVFASLYPVHLAFRIQPVRATAME